MIRVLLLRVAPAGLVSQPVGPPPVAPPIGLLSLASALRDHPTLEVEVVVKHLSVDLEVQDDTALLVQEFAPQIVGLSALSVDAVRLFECARLAKSTTPAPLVVAGGPTIVSTAPRLAAAWAKRRRGKNRRTASRLFSFSMKLSIPPNPRICFWAIAWPLWETNPG